MCNLNNQHRHIHIHIYIYIYICIEREKTTMYTQKQVPPGKPHLDNAAKMHQVSLQPGISIGDDT